MSDRSAIEWCDASWPVTYGCTKVSPGCAHCYIERTPPYRMSGLKFERGSIPVTLKPERLDWPLRWRKPRRIFVCSLSDLFHEDVPDSFIDQVFAVMSLCNGEAFRCAPRCKHEDYERCYAGSTQQPEHTFQVLTKRPDRMLAYLTADDVQWRIGDAVQDVGWYDMPELVAEATGWPMRNVWIGVSVENQHWADERIPLLLRTPAAIRFLSVEPMLGPVDLRPWLSNDVYEGTSNDDADFVVAPGLAWVIVGGESGPKHRPFDLAWARDLRDQCSAAGVPLFVKQGASARPGRFDDLPDDLKVREFPDAQRS